MQCKFIITCSDDINTIYSQCSMGVSICHIVAVISNPSLINQSRFTGVVCHKWDNLTVEWIPMYQSSSQQSPSQKN